MKWHVHTHELPWTVNDSITSISSKQAIPIQDFQVFKSFGFLFAEACFQASKQTQIWNWMWEWAEKPKPQSQLMTIGSLKLKMKYPLGSYKKTTLWESWLSSNSPMQRLLSLNGKFYQRDAEQNLSTTLPLHHYFLFALSSWSLWTASQKSLCDGELQADGKISHKICKKCSGEMTVDSTVASWFLYKQLATKRLMNPARGVLISPSLCLVHAIQNRSPPSLFREGRFVLHRNSRQQMWLLAATWRNTRM